MIEKMCSASKFDLKALLLFSFLIISISLHYCNANQIKISEKTKAEIWKYLPDGCADFYTHPNFQGQSERHCNSPSSSQIYLLSKEYLKSVRLSPDVKIEFKLPNYGFYWTFSYPEKYLGSYLQWIPETYINFSMSFNPQNFDQTRPEPNCILLYYRCGNRGNFNQKYCVSSDRPDVKGNIFKNNYSYCSIKAGENVKALLSDPSGASYYIYPGAQIDYISYTVDVQEYSMSLVTPSDQEVPREGCVFFYARDEFMGPKQNYCGSMSNYMTMTIKSLKLGPETILRLNYNSQIQTFFQDNKTLTKLDRIFENAIFGNFVINLTNDPAVPNPGCTFMYERCNYRGKKFEFCSWSKAIDPSFFAGKISSIKLGDNTQVQIFSENEYNGKNSMIANTKNVDCFSTADPNSLSFSPSNIDYIPKSMKVYITPIDESKPDSSCVFIYSRCGFSGDKVNLCANKTNKISIPQLLYQRNMSIKLGQGTEVELFDANTSKNNSIKLVSNVDCFTDSSDNTVKSFASLAASAIIQNAADKSIPKTGCVFLYSDCNFYGNKWERCQGGFDDISIVNPGFVIKSFKVGQFARLYLYNLTGMTGDSIVKESDEKCLTVNQDSFKKDTVKSLNVRISTNVERKAGCVAFYNQCYFQGDPVTICEDTPLIYIKYLTAKAVKSIIMGFNTLATAYTQSDYTGKSFQVQQYHACLGDSEEFSIFQNNINSIKIKKSARVFTKCLPNSLPKSILEISPLSKY